MRRTPLTERLKAYTVVGECWQWNRATDRFGYGFIKIGRKMLKAHRVSYELHKGTIPPGYLIHHTCEHKWCINPAHLVPQLPREHTLGHNGPAALNAKKTHCIRGHKLTGVRPGGKRYCKECGNAQSRKWFRTHATRQERGLPPIRSSQPWAKLDPTRIGEIRARYAAGNISQRQLAAEYGVVRGTIGHILHDRVWRQQSS